MYNKDCLFPIHIGASPVARTTIAIGGARYTLALDATSDEHAILFQVEKDITIADVAVSVNAVTGSPQYTVSLQGLTAGGAPDGTIKGGGSPASAQWSPAGTPTPPRLEWITLDNTYAATRGEWLAIVIEDGTAGTNPDVSNNVTIQHWNTQLNASIPYHAFSTNTGSSWTRLQDDIPIYGIRGSDTTAVQGFPAFDPLNQNNVGTASGHICGQAFKLPKKLGRRVKIGGVVAEYCYANVNYKMGIWDASGTEIGASASMDADYNGNTLFLSSRQGFFDPVWLDTDTKYYLGIELQASGAIVMYAHDCAADDNLSAFPNYPDNNSAFYNGTSWSEDTGQIIGAAMLLVTDIDPGERMHEIESGVTRL